MKLLITVQGIQYEVDVEVLDDSVQIPASAEPAATPAAHRAVPVTPAPASPRKKPAAAPAAGGGANSVTSPLAGNVFKVEVQPGQEVKAHDVLIILEAMKMETPIKSSTDAKVKAVHVSPGDAVTAGQVLVEFE